MPQQHLDLFGGGYPKFSTIDKDATVWKFEKVSGWLTWFLLYEGIDDMSLLNKILFRAWMEVGEDNVCYWCSACNVISSKHKIRQIEFGFCQDNK